jgi:diguanylate cyclase (GGDEF)-like protein
MEGLMAKELALLMRPGVGPPPSVARGQDFSVLLVGNERELAALVEELLRDAGLPQAQVTTTVSLDAALAHLANERPGIMFYGVFAPDLGSLSALVRLQAAAPGVPVVPLPVPPAGLPPSPWWTMRAHRAFDRNEVVGLLQQVALLDENARQLFYLATHDRLTGLANRWLLEERLRHAIARSRRSGVSGAVLFIDLDDFKSINDRHGHEVGDRMLVIAAERLVEAVRASDTVARWGGDEFAVILEGVRHRETAHDKGRRLVQRLAEPTEGAEAGGALRASVGVALFPDDGEDVPTLLAQADRRMYRAKGRRVLWSVFRRG